MKTISSIGLICLLVAGSIYANAQRIGIQGGVNMNLNTVTIADTKPMTSSLTAWQLGGVFEYSFTEHIEVNGGLLFTKKGATISSSSGDSYIKLSYIELPINIAYNLPISNNGNFFFIQAGPYVSYALHGTYLGNRITFGGKNGEYNNYDIGAGVGLGWKFSAFKATFGYEYGFTDIPNISGDKMHNQLLSFSLACFLNFKQE